MRRLLAAVSLMALALVPLGPADGALIVSSSIDGGPVIFAIDNSALNTCGTPVAGPCQLPDTDPALGSLALNPFLTAGGDVSVQASLQTADIATVPGTVNRLDSTGTQVTNTGAVSHSFAVAIGATDFQGPVAHATTTGAGQWSHLGGGFGDSEIDMCWYNDPLNTQGGLNPLGVAARDSDRHVRHTPDRAEPELVLAHGRAVRGERPGPVQHEPAVLGHPRARRAADRPRTDRGQAPRRRPRPGEPESPGRGPARRRAPRLAALPVTAAGPGAGTAIARPGPCWGSSACSSAPSC